SQGHYGLSQNHELDISTDIVVTNHRLHLAASQLHFLDFTLSASPPRTPNAFAQSPHVLCTRFWAPHKRLSPLAKGCSPSITISLHSISLLQLQAHHKLSAFGIRLTGRILVIAVV
ncbi:hypothetical protein KC19_3G017600, partial [Ceratodon purpureus]